MPQHSNDEPSPQNAASAAGQAGAAAQSGQKLPDKKAFPIVGIGASAGGLAALETFFKHTPATINMAFVVVMHLMADRESNLASLLQKYASLPIHQIKDGMAVEPGHIYVIPPNHELGIRNDVLQLLEPSDTRRPMAIDGFLRHLAQDRGPRAIGVIMSGSGTDGTLGLKAISEKGGLVVVQEPDTAAYASMPRSAIDTGLVDMVLAPAAMPQHLIGYIDNADFKAGEKKLDPNTEDGINQIFQLLQAETGHDFSQYRSSTLFRRISKRMAIHRSETISDYVDYMRKNLSEVKNLYQDILIGVTQFFREPDAFEAIKEKVLPALFEERDVNRPLRIWVPGCSTGEEAYSLAILLHDYLQSHKSGLRVDIFATDINDRVVEKARQGQYPSTVAADVPQPYLDRYFTRQDHTYQINSDIREMLIFAGQNLLSDPPFSKLDLISCRNLLIYMKSDTQRKVMALFQYSLRPGGFLFLGSSESLGEYADYFEVIDRKWRLFKRTNRQAVAPADVGFFNHQAISTNSEAGGQQHRPPSRSMINRRHLLERSLLEHYEAVGIMIDEDYSILYMYGPVDQYLQVAPGEPTLDIMDMLRPGLELELAPAIRHVLNTNEPVRQRRVWAKTNGDEKVVNFVVRPVLHAPQKLALIIIEEVEPPAAGPEPEERPEIKVDVAANGDQVEALKKELLVTKKRLQHAVEELQIASEEHRSYAEELQSANEELQSTNEELTTSQEELRSVNEELVTANTEIQWKNAELRQANNDLHNLLAGTDIATIFLDSELKIKRYTPAASKIVNLIQGDIGRPLEHTVSNLRTEGLIRDAKQVLETLGSIEREVQTEAGDWYNMHIVPYRTREDMIDGVVLTFSEITPQKDVEAELRRLNQELRQARDYNQKILDTLHESVLILDRELRIVSANKPFTRQFELDAAEIEGKTLYELNEGQWDIPTLRRLLEEVIPENRLIEQFELAHEFPQLGPRRLRLNARQMVGPGDDDDDEATHILLAIEDVT